MQRQFNQSPLEERMAYTGLSQSADYERRSRTWNEISVWLPETLQTGYYALADVTVANHPSAILVSGYSKNGVSDAFRVSVQNCGTSGAAMGSTTYMIDAEVLL